MVCAEGDRLCYEGQAKEQGKKDKFHRVLTIAGLKWPHHCWVKMLKMRIQLYTTSTLNVMEMVTLIGLQ